MGELTLLFFRNCLSFAPGIRFRYFFSVFYFELHQKGKMKRELDTLLQLSSCSFRITFFFAFLLIFFPSNQQCICKQIHWLLFIFGPGRRLICVSVYLLFIFKWLKSIFFGILDCNQSLYYTTKPYTISQDLLFPFFSH